MWDTNSEKKEKEKERKTGLDRKSSIQIKTRWSRYNINNK